MEKIDRKKPWAKLFRTAVKMSYSRKRGRDTQYELSERGSELNIIHVEKSY